MEEQIWEDEEIEKLLELMKKYISYVKKCSGKNYITDLDLRKRAKIEFTDKEWELLKTLI